MLFVCLLIHTFYTVTCIESYAALTPQKQFGKLWLLGKLWLFLLLIWMSYLLLNYGHQPFNLILQTTTCVKSYAAVPPLHWGGKHCHGRHLKNYQQFSFSYLRLPEIKWLCLKKSKCLCVADGRWPFRFAHILAVL